jgi:hypothetical protein
VGLNIITRFLFLRDTNLSFFWVEMPPGHGPQLHAHPYHATFTIAGTPQEVVAFRINLSTPVMNRSSKQMIADWLED